MGKSTVINQDWSQIHNENQQGLSNTLGDGNTTTVNTLDGDAIKESLQFAGRNSDGTFKSVGDVLGTIGTFASEVIKNQQKQSDATLSALTQTTKDATGNVKNAYSDAYTRAENNGLKPETILIIVAGLAAIAFIFKGA